MQDRNTYYMWLDWSSTHFRCHMSIVQQHGDRPHGVIYNTEHKQRDVGYMFVEWLGSINISKPILSSPSKNFV